MLNKPKFMSPSINMYGNTVIDLNSDTLPFSCIVDGDEAIKYFQIIVSRLEDNSVVFDSGKRELKPLFYPINNRNQNVVFSINLRDYFSKAYVLNTSSEYDPSKTYYEYNTSTKKYVEYTNPIDWSVDYSSLYVISNIPLVLNTNTTYDENRIYYAYDETTKIYSKYTYSSATDWNNKRSSLHTVNFVNSEDAYYWNITFWSTKDNTVLSSGEVFYANSTPETTVYFSYDNKFTDSSGEYLSKYLLSTDKNNPSVLSSRKIYFKAKYTQEDEIHLKRYGWRITDTDNNIVVMDTITQNQIYGVEDDISCECNGFINDTNYLIELYIETQNGYFDIVKDINFKVDYTVKEIDATFEVVALNETSGIMLNWGDVKTTEGVVEGDEVEYAENFPINNTTSIKIPENSKVVFSENANGKDLEIDENSYIVLSFQFDKSYDTKLFEITGLDSDFYTISRTLTYTASDTKLIYTVTKGDITKTIAKAVSMTAEQTGWYVVTLYPLAADNTVDFEVSESIANANGETGLYPEESLFPTAENSDNILYPEFGEWNHV